MPESNHHFLEQLAATGLYPPPGAPAHARNGGPAAPVPAPDTPAAYAYGAAALDSEAAALAATPEGLRNATLNRAAFRMGQLIPDYLSATDADAHLTDAALAAGLGATEIAATLASGLAAGQQARREVTLRAGLDPAYTLPATPAVVGSALSEHLTAVPPSAGHTAPDLGGDSAGTAGTGPADGLPVPLDWVALFAGTRTEPDWLVPDVIERGRSHVLYASHKAGKSLVVQAWCAELAIHGGRVLYVDYENSAEDLVERLRDDMGYRAEQLATLYYLSYPAMAALDTPAGGATLYALALAYQVELVVLDTTARVVVGEENSSDTYRHLYRYAGVPLKAAGIAVLRLDHAGKDPLAGQRGSSSKGDDVDTVWRLVRVGEEHVRLHCDAQRSGHHPPQVDYTLTADPLRLVRLVDPFAAPEVTALVDTLDRLGVPATAGRHVARAALSQAGVRVRNEVLARALNARKVRLTSWDDLSGTGGPANDLVKINNICPQDQQGLFESAGQTCPGQAGDSGDSSRRVQKVAPVPPPARLKGGQEGTGGLDLPRAGPPEMDLGPAPGAARVAGGSGPGCDPVGEGAGDSSGDSSGERGAMVGETPSGDPGGEDDPRRCSRCRRVAGEVRTMAAGRWRRLCVECAYPGGGAETTDNPTEE